MRVRSQAHLKKKKQKEDRMRNAPPNIKYVRPADPRKIHWYPYHAKKMHINEKD